MVFREHLEESPRNKDPFLIKGYELYKRGKHKFIQSQS